MKSKAPGAKGPQKDPLSAVKKARALKKQKTERLFEGLGVSPGIAIGPAYVRESGIVEVTEYAIPVKLIDKEIGRFEAAVNQATRQLQSLKTKASTLPAATFEELGYLLDAHLHMLRGSRLVRGVEARIAKDRINAEAAVQAEIAEISKGFAAMDDAYLAARMEDIREVGVRLVRCLTKTPPLAFSTLTPAFADTDKPFRILSLSGTGEVKAVPDTASISAGVVTDAKDAKSALAKNSTAMNKLFKQLKAAGVADRDIQTANFNISPVYAPYNPKKPVPQHQRIIGYKVSNGVTVRVRKLARLGALIDEMTVAGANRMNGISFFVDKTDNLLEQARKKAMADVRRKADLYASGLGVELKRVLTINENVSRPGRPRPVYRGLAMAKDSAREAAPVAAGEQELSVTVSVSWELE